MNATSSTNIRSRRPHVSILSGGIVLGAVDAAFAYAFWAGKGVTLTRIFQSIAAGALGDASYAGGAATAWLGAVLHFFIATVMVFVYYLASRRFAVLTRRPIVLGLLYGLMLYAAMNFVVLPLSAAGMPEFGDTAWVASSVVVHAALGVVCALFARKAVAS